MTPFEAAVLGLIQGTTEFLPISSSAHLILTSRLLGWQDQGLHFDMAANTGSLVALIAYFRSDLRNLVREWLNSWSGAWRSLSPDATLAWLLGIATIPVAIIGFIGQHLFGTVARSAVLIALTSIVFGLLLGLAERKNSARKILDLSQIDLRIALLIGTAQALALIPGTSRSGITITAGLLLGLSRPVAARFALLLAIPVGLLVGIKDLADIAVGGVVWNELTTLSIGFVVSAVSAFLVIGWLLRWVEGHSLTGFAIYRVVLGLVILALLA
jgi:undecaprenyl-diphosphatase